jgi:acetoin utilization deacetylase AcuC-like enzyme
VLPRSEQASRSELRELNHCHGILDAFKKRMTPPAEKFQPELVRIPVGFDGRKYDLLRNCAVTDEGFAKLTRLTMGTADKYARSRLVSVPEGGYNPENWRLPLTLI